MAALGSISLHHDNLTVITGLTACVAPPYLFLIGIVDIALKGNLYIISCTHCNLSSCVSRYNFGYEVVVLHQPSFVMLPVNITGPWYRDTGSHIKRTEWPKPVWLSGWSVGLQTEGSQVRFQSRACTWVAGTSPVGDVQEAADRCFSLINVSNSLSLSLPLCKKSIKYIFKKRERERTE
uniref:Uncharacterized protein n=1 Tax=Myotis myotis TaxID=51298 RepID=A0A7J7RDP6_MYOMY|nr:hypothetical protein mMyoMyo1_010371 [Myotis myotis]